VLVSASLSIGCGGSDSAKKPSSTEPSPSPSPSASGDKPAKHEGHDQAHGAGPHGGTLSDWGGGQYHVEFTVDHDKQEATIYILGDDEKTPSSIKAEEIQLSIKAPAFQIALKAFPQDGDPEGGSSRFVGKHENLGKVQEFAGTISGEVDGTPYTGDFVEEPH
jgi:hypothetical protein